MRDAMQKQLDELASFNDPRLNVFDVQLKDLTHETIVLTGKLLDEKQLEALRELFSNHFPGLSLDTASVRILDREVHERVHVATNLTGLYEKPTFGMPLSSELYFGTELEVLEAEKRWVFVRQGDGYLGWAYRPYLGEGTAPEATHLVLAPAVEVHLEPDESSQPVTRLVSGTGVTVEERREDWSRIAANQLGWIPSSTLRSVTGFPKTIEEQRTMLIADSMRMIGVPYLWGGTSGNGIDCSGFARLLHHWLGVQIPRDADMQCDAAKPVEPPFEVGDLLFFGEDDSNRLRSVTHVGISLGGWKMIHSSRSHNGVYIDDLQERKSLLDIFVRAGSFLR